MFRIKNACGQSWCVGVGWVLPESGDVYDSLDDLPVELEVEGTPFEEAETFYGDAGGRLHHLRIGATPGR